MEYRKALDLLTTKYSVKFVDYTIAKNKQEALEFARQGYPVVLKILSKDIVHKTEKGCVKVDLRTSQEVEQAYDEIMKNAEDAKFDGMLVQRLAKKGIELFVGGKQDPQFGPIILFGLGGIFVEVLQDISIRICPIEKEDAEEMIEEIHAYPLLNGARGIKPVNKEALVELLVNVSKFLDKEDVNELDLNPVIANNKDYEVVDLRTV